MTLIYRSDPEPARDTVWCWPEHPGLRLWWDDKLGWTANGSHGYKWSDFTLDEFPMTLEGA